MMTVSARASARLKGDAGMTLTEVTIVVAIIGLLVMVAVPNFQDWNQKYKLKDAIGLMHGYMNLARMNAINQNTPVTVTVTQTSPTARVTVTFRNPGGANVVPPLTLDTGLSLTNATGVAVGSGVTSPQDVRFNSMGLRTNTGNANNLCITNTGTYTGAACTGASTQAFNFMNPRGLNYRIVVASTGKASWCYTAACAQ
jgi:prepilin-type N-terminal cleavage/methylation domain-containing protein